MPPPQRRYVHPQAVPQAACPRCGAAKIAHCAQNVSFAANNVNRRRPSNRSQQAPRRAKTAFVRHTLGERNSCKRYRNSCNAYSGARTASPSAGRRGPFSSRKHRIFTVFNQRPASSPRFRYISSKPAAPCLRYFRARGGAVHSAPLLEVNKCEEADCTLCPGQRCARPMGHIFKKNLAI